MQGRRARQTASSSSGPMRLAVLAGATVHRRFVVAASMVLLTRHRTGLPGVPGVGRPGRRRAGISHSEYGRRPPEVTAVLVAGRPAIAFVVAFALLLQQRRADLAATWGAVPVPPGEPRSIRPATPTPVTSSSPPQLQPLPVVASALSPEPVPTTHRHPCRNHQCRPPEPSRVGKLPVARTDDEDDLVARVRHCWPPPRGSRWVAAR